MESLPNDQRTLDSPQPTITADWQSAALGQLVSVDLPELLHVKAEFRMFFDGSSQAYRLALIDPAEQSGPQVVLLSSHLSRDWERWSPWFDRLRPLLDELSSRKAWILTCDNTTTHRFLAALSDDYDWSLITVALPEPQWSWREWLHQAATCWLQSPASAARTARRCWVSPVLPSTKWADSSRPIRSGNLDRDAILMGIGEEVHALYVRPRGRLAQAVEGYARGSDQLNKLWLHTGDQAVPDQLVQRWCDLGAKTLNATMQSVKSTSQILSCPNSVVLWGEDEPELICENQARHHSQVNLQRLTLSHWTRASTGPWPGESESEFLRQLLYEPIARARSACTVLQRILAMERLVASGRLIRCGTPVVCFTAQPVEQFAERSVYRSHLGRWDFTPYGLCFHRDWLVSQGARPVVYGDNQTWREMEVSERAFFQPTHRRRAVGHPEQLDLWTEESEWRIIGDVDFSKCPTDQLSLFVPDRETADYMERRSRWPVLCLSEWGLLADTSRDTPASSSDIPTCQQSQATQSDG